MKTLSMEILQSYQINTSTQAIEPCFEGNAKALVREEGGAQYYVKQTPAAIISHACLENGSSLKGRGDAVKHLTGFVRRKPIPIDEKRRIFAFPIHSQRSPDNVWLFYSHVRPAKTEGVIIFRDQSTMTTEASAYSIQQQLLRTSHCMSHFTDIG